LVSDAIVSDLIVDGSGRAKGVHYIDRGTHQHREVYAQVVVVAAGALESTRILLNSKSPAHPQGVGNSTGVLGHYLMDHFTIEGAGGSMPSLHSSKREAVGRPCGFLIPKYVNATGGAPKDRNSNFVRGYRFDGDGSQELYGHAFLMPEIGDACRKRVREEIPYYFAIEAQGECLPRADNFVRLDSTKKDAWGIPVLHINASYGENEKAMGAAMREDISGILDAMKLTDATPPKADISVFGKNIHECGTARMGSDPKKSVVDANCKVHDAPNVFVTDGAVFTTQGCYEPTLTIMAISARAGEHIAQAFRRGEL
jgi:choline dehydrogenase-like flavoprotein